MTTNWLHNAINPASDSGDDANNATCEFCGASDESVRQIDPNDRDQPYLLGRGVLHRMACSTCYERELVEAIDAAGDSDVGGVVE